MASNPGNRVILLVGTQKGLFRLISDSTRRHWQITGPLIGGYEIPHVWLDPRQPERGFAAANHLIWGAHVYTSTDAGHSWQSLAAAPRHPLGEHDTALRQVWHLAPGDEPGTLYAGIDPAGLFVSHDGGASWTGVDGLNHHPTRSAWEPAKGGFFVHSTQVGAADPRRLVTAVSAGGAYRSDDGGTRWQPINTDIPAAHLPQQAPEAGHNIHKLLMHPADPQRLYRQCYQGVFRSDDGGATWESITAGLPSGFGYALASEATAPDTLYTVPIDSNHLRTAAEARLRVFRTEDGGRCWQALTNGLPQEHAYVSVLREALAVDDLPECGVYLGTSGGHLFASPNRGNEWQMVAGFLPRILCVSAIAIPEARDG